MNKIQNYLFVVVLMAGTVFLTACGNSTDGANGKSNSQSANGSPTQQENEVSSNAEKNTEEESSDTTDKTQPNEEPSESSKNNGSHNSSDSDEPESIKEDYLKKLENMKTKTNELKAESSATYALKKVEDDRWDMWDGLLNEIYGVLKEQLSTEEMDQLQKEQRNWIKHRDDTALEASYKYKGGTQEHLEYSAVAANLTEERCHFLVENYMK